MGHLTNPTGFRLGRSVNWPYMWTSDKLSYYKFYNIVQSGCFIFAIHICVLLLPYKKTRFVS